MVKRKAEVDADASQAPARRSSRKKPSDDKVKSETPIPKFETKTSPTTAKKPSHKNAVKAEVKVGPILYVVIVRSAMDRISIRFYC